jgi:hypothetical protein
MNNGKVGYKSPPLHSRFQKGESGNPRGRPRNKPTKSTRQSFDEVLARRVPVKRADGKQVRMSLRDVVLEKLVQEAIKGDTAARRDVFALMKLLGEFAPRPSQERVGVVVVERPCATTSEWLELAAQTSLPLNPLEGLPGLTGDECDRSPARAPKISPQED